MQLGLHTLRLSASDLKLHPGGGMLMVYDWAWSEHSGSESELELSDHENTDVEAIIGIAILYNG